MTAIRLALAQGSRYSGVNVAALNAPTVYLAHAPGAQGDNALMGRKGVERIPDSSRPSLLISFVYLRQWLKHQSRVAYREWVLDSGAFTAHASGEAIDLAAYIETAKRLRAEDPTLAEVFALDVIGDHHASRRNAERMVEAGVPCVPTFHFGSPYPELVSLARDFPKVALGGCARKKVKERQLWLRECFARVWPKKVHGFGISDRPTLLMFPFHSVDASSWELAPAGFGIWRAYGRTRINWRGSEQNLRAEIEYYLTMERELRQRWARDMAMLEGSSDANGAGAVRRSRLDGAASPPAGRGSRGPRAQRPVRAAAQQGGRGRDAAVRPSRR